MAEQYPKTYILDQDRPHEGEESSAFGAVQDLIIAWKGEKFARRLSWRTTEGGAELRLEAPDVDEIPEGFSGTVSGYRVTDSFARYFSYDELAELYKKLREYGFEADRNDLDRSIIRLSKISEERDTDTHDDIVSSELVSVEQRERELVSRRLIDTVLEEITRNYDEVQEDDDARLEYLELARAVVHFMAERGEDPDQLLVSLHELSEKHAPFAPFVQWFDARMQGPFFRFVKASYPASASQDVRTFGGALRHIGESDAQLTGSTTSLQDLEKLVKASRDSSSGGWSDVALGDSVELELMRQYAYNGQWDKISSNDLYVSEDNERSVAIDIIIHAFKQEHPRLDIAQLLETICDCDDEKTRHLLCEIVDLWYGSGQESLCDMANTMLTSGLFEAETRADKDDNYSFWFVSILHRALSSQRPGEAEDFYNKLVVILSQGDLIFPYLLLFDTARIAGDDRRRRTLSVEKIKKYICNTRANEVDLWDIECWAARLGHGEEASDTALCSRFRTALTQLLDAEIPHGNDDIRIWGLERIIAHMRAAEVPQGIIQDVLDTYVNEDVMTKEYTDLSLQKIFNLYVRTGFDKQALSVIDTLYNKRKINETDYERFKQELLEYTQLRNKSLYGKQKKQSDVVSLREYYMLYIINPTLDLFLSTDFTIEDLALWLTSDERFNQEEQASIANRLLYWCADNPLDSRMQSVLDLALQHYDFGLEQDGPSVFIDIIQGLRLQDAFENNESRNKE
ncbi:MAG: hypothetical protein HYV41_03670 [Candidatus Magasanikbacteria bacterium]|nr:hypothetical protein [Candidatus Magasanikbacteria bacterium]